MLKLPSLIGALFLIFGCNPQSGKVQIREGGIYVPITFGVDGTDASGKKLDLGEWVITDGPKPLTVTVTNNTLYPYTEIDLTFSSVAENSSALTYAALDNGETLFPGKGGTCARTLLPGLSCTIKVSFSPAVDGMYKEQMHLSFKNFVDFENHIAQVDILAGLPAELSIVEGPSRMAFGELVGSTTLVERTEIKTYTKNFSITNVGGLTARNIKINHLNICKDLFGNNCARPEYENAFNLESLNCKDGDNIKPGETCNFIIKFNPKNNAEDVDNRFTRITYSANTLIEYKKTPKGDVASYGLSYQSLSTKIEGNFTSAGSIDLSNEDEGVVQGNSIYRTIRLTNNGYRSLKLRSLLISKPNLVTGDDETWALCERDGANLTMLCHKPLSVTPLTFEEFPLKVVDENDCFGDKNTAKLLAVNAGCVLKVTFQPSSINFFSAPAVPADFTETNYELADDTKIPKFFVHYDSQWKSGANHCDEDILNGVPCTDLIESTYLRTDDFFTAKLKRKSAAKLVIEDVQYIQNSLTKINSVSTCDANIPPVCTVTEMNETNNDDINFLATYDFDRLTLLAASQGSNSTNFKSIKITLKNIGETKAILEGTDLGIKYFKEGTETRSLDHEGLITIPTLDDANNCTGNTCFYRSAKTNEDCSEISSSGTCTIEIKFAPFLLASNLEDKAMFDFPFPAALQDGSIPAKFKSFKVIYENGVQYTDAGTVEDNAQSVLRIRAILTRAGKLAELADDPRNFKQINEEVTKGAEARFKLYLSNIGSGPVSKLDFTLTGTDYSYYIATADKECDTVNNIYDCRCFTTSATCTTYDLLNPPANLLYPDQECYLPVQWKSSSNNLMNELSETERGAMSSNDLYRDLDRVNYKTYSSGGSVSAIGKTTYNNCFQHTATEVRSAGYDESYGYPRPLVDFTTEFKQFFPPAKLTPSLPSSSFPWHAAALFRSPMSISEVVGAVTNTYNFAERFFYKNKTDNSTWSVTQGIGSPFINSTHQGALELTSSIIDSSSYINSLKDTNINYAVPSDTIQYHFFMGHYPKFTLSNPTLLAVPLYLDNLGGVKATITSFSVDTVSSYHPIVLKLGGVNLDTNPPAPSSILFNASTSKQFVTEINPSLCSDPTCIYATKVSLTYDTGKLNKTYKPLTNSWETACDAGDKECSRTIEIYLFAEIKNETTTPITLSISDVSVEKVSGVMEENCSLTESTLSSLSLANGSWNQGANGPTPFVFLAPKIAAGGTDYRKKVIKLTNTSASTIKLSKVMLRLAGESASITNTAITVNHLGNFPTCTTPIESKICSANKTLISNDYCYVALKFQPTTTAISTYQLSFLLGEVNKPQYLYNHPITFEPIPPATVVPVVAGVTVAKPRIKLSIGDRDAYRLNNTTYPTYYFTQSGPNNKLTFYQNLRNTIANTSVKASLLAEWRLTNNTCGTPCNPTAANFATDSNSPGGSQRYILLKQVNPGFMKVYASETCLFGSDPVESHTNTSGFNTTISNCYLRMEVELKHDNMVHTSNIQNASMMDPYSTQIEYYDSGRTTTSNFIIFLDFKIRPKIYVAPIGSQWGPITSTSTATTLKFPLLEDPSVESIGDIIGYRIIRSKLSGDLSPEIFVDSVTSDYKKSFSKDYQKFDIFLNGTFPPTVTGTFSVAHDIGRLYYFKLLAIRRHASFTKGDSMFGFGADKKDHFVTEISNFPIELILVPQANKKYYHTERFLIDSANSNSTPSRYGGCGSTITFSKDGATNNKTLNTKLINPAAWSKLSALEKQDPLWIFSSTPHLYSVVCPDMGPNELTEATDTCFRLDPDVLSGREIRGAGDYNLNNTQAYIDPSLEYGFYRCMTDLSTLY